MAELGCLDCGLRDLVVLQWDHRDPAEKSANVSLLITRSHFAEAQAEIAKCDVRCANCHRLKTAKERETYKERLFTELANVSAVERVAKLNEWVGMAEPRVLETQVCGRCEKELPMTDFAEYQHGRICATCTPLVVKDYQARKKANGGKLLQAKRRIDWGLETADCTRCGVSRPFADFQKRKNKPHSWCRSCRRGKPLKYRLARSDRHRERNQKYAFAVLSISGCVDCAAAGSTTSDPRVLDFDHVRGEKARNIAHMLVQGYSIAAIQAEMGKCDARCPNCHITRTAAAANSYVRRRELRAELKLATWLA